MNIALFGTSHEQIWTRNSAIKVIYLTIKWIYINYLTLSLNVLVIKSKALSEHPQNVHFKPNMCSRVIYFILIPAASKWPSSYFRHTRHAQGHKIQRFRRELLFYSFLILWFSLTYSYSIQRWSAFNSLALSCVRSLLRKKEIYTKINTKSILKIILLM
jgi:hypothetical protein